MSGPAIRPVSRRTRFAIVGLGAFAERYVRALQGMSGVEVTWGVGRDPLRTAEAAARLGLPRHATSVAEACADDTVDAVIVCTPEDAHREAAVAALDAGKHVIVEKPLASTDEDGVAMVRAARSSRKLLMPAFLLRFDYRYARLKQRLQEIEPVHSVYAYRNFDRSLFRLYSRTHSFIENAIHDIDLMLWYLDSPVVRVHGFCRNTLGLPNPDVNWGVLEFASGALGVLQTTWLYPDQRHADLQWNAGIHVMGARGVLECANDAGGFIANTDETGILLLDQTGWADIHGEARGAFGAMLRHCVACIRAEAEYAGTTPEQALEAMRIACRLVEDSQRRLPASAHPLQGEGQDVCGR
ncbi:MAG: Gfo/Idh/MocA family oxidoreductase [Chthonomonadales bacterium]|nr:Gfo/Idh/MocA family oxidoreductase [Chthonomonadales bacterium]